MADEKSFLLGARRKPDDGYQCAERLLLQYGSRHGPSEALVSMLEAKGIPSVVRRC